LTHSGTCDGIQREIPAFVVIVFVMDLPLRQVGEEEGTT
jgi:hypothetical protein